jgi:hypothetical protein
MGQMELIALPLVWMKEVLHSVPHGLNGIRVIPGAQINEGDGVVNGAVRVTDQSVICMRSSSITDDRSAGFDPSTYNIHQRVSGSIQYGNKESSTGFTFNTTKHPLSLIRVSPNGQHSLSAEHTPVCDSVLTEVMFMLDVMGRFATQDVIGKVQDLLEGNVGVVEPRAVPDRSRPRTPGSTYPSNIST